MAQDIQTALAASSSLGAGGEEEAEDELKASGVKSFSSMLSVLLSSFTIFLSFLTFLHDSLLSFSIFSTLFFLLLPLFSSPSIFSFVCLFFLHRVR